MKPYRSYVIPAKAGIQLIPLLLLVTAYTSAWASESFTAVSPAHRVALLELYTSEGCSSCPPADKFMSRLKDSGISEQQLVPLSFHVTYWDYIGWQDRFGNSEYDDRQRKQAMLNHSRNVYTPQFMMNGSDFRRHNSFDAEIQRINSNPATHQLELIASPDTDTIDVVLNTKTLTDNSDEAVAYIALYEHDLSSDVTDGENEGEHLRHDYVVRELKGPYFIEQYPAEIKASFKRNGYRMENTGVVAFIQKPLSSEILQAVQLEIEQ